MRYLSVLAALPLLLSAPALAAPVQLAPHRVVYDLSLATSRGTRGVDGARGRIAFELTGNACEGYSLKFRQVTVIDSDETGTRTSDLRSVNFESADGSTFRFRNDTQTSGGARTSVDGAAERGTGGAVSLRLRMPRRAKSALGSAIFPNVQMKELIEAAEQGRTMVAQRLYDGSDDGRKVYDTLAVIGPKITGSDAGLEPAARQEVLRNLARWPVTLSYFGPGRGDRTPDYTLAFDLYEDGISRALRLDYGDFSLRGDMRSLELLPTKSCRR